MKTVIMAGGRGTRISSVASDIPKPMIKIEGKPVLEHELECLRDRSGFLVFYVQPDHQDAVRWAMRDLMYIPFEFEDGGTRVIHYTPEIYVP